MPTAASHLPLDELARLGTDAFDRHIKPTLRPEDDGKFVAIDVLSGEYEVDRSDHTAVTRLRARATGAAIWLVQADVPPPGDRGAAR